MMRGLPQGAPESPRIFILVMELVLRPLLQRWRSQGRGWCMDSLWLAAICYADDIVLVSASLPDLQRMAEDFALALSDVGLEVGAKKCHWTSYPPLPDTKFSVNGAALSWEKHICFVGSVLNLAGNDGPALELRLTQAEKTFHRWRPYLQATGVHAGRRMTLLRKAVFSSALWLSETWTLTKQQQKRLKSFGARLAARTCLIRRKDGEDLGQFWRRMHRSGHSLLGSSGGSLERSRATRLHAFAGHMARSQQDLLISVLRVRCLAWWRYRQARHKNKHNGVHPKRFKAWCWESQLTKH